jgi:hypothetical protein
MSTVPDPTSIHWPEMIDNPEKNESIHGLAAVRGVVTLVPFRVARGGRTGRG